jgi:hypothetical protein
MLMMVAMVVSTTMPAASHASMNHDHSGKVAHSEKAASAEKVSAHADCDHHSEKASGKTQNKHEKPCCEKGMCKCIGGNCHSGGMAKLSGDGNVALLTRDASGNQFAFAEEHIESATLARLKRPPKA